MRFACFFWLFTYAFLELDGLVRDVCWTGFAAALATIGTATAREKSRTQAGSFITSSPWKKPLLDFIRKARRASVRALSLLVNRRRRSGSTFLKMRRLERCCSLARLFKDLPSDPFGPMLLLQRNRFCSAGVPGARRLLRGRKRVPLAVGHDSWHRSSPPSLSS